MDSLPALFHRALNNASRAANLPTIEDETQELVASALKDMRTVRTRVADLALFSPNESLEDISSRDLVYLLVPFALAEIEQHTRATERDARLTHLREAEQAYGQFVGDVELYEVVPPAERELYGKRAKGIADAARRRETKIKQYQHEKEIRGKIEALAKRRHILSSPNTSPTDFDLIASLLPAASAPQDEDEDAETEDLLRDATLLLIRLTYAQAQAQIDSLADELMLLRTAPPPAPAPPPGEQRGVEDGDTWRLDAPPPSALLDPSGKPLRPFTILPSNAADRARVQAQVFQAGHRLPTMSIDEYLEIEQQRGNVITGGGPQSEAQPTTSEQLALDAEEDGTAFGEAKEEARRQKDENWARYTDVNPRGAGNTMNRG
ncbi:TAP42-like protein [Auriscalpium vulgare]|uniref:TAP42-like protein n=2 Tax=Auriscalpium vulgare TaxID=40419 RepID=A0ACB8RFL9_9AGAM|nr:TAP42-like protein [Auriscalpium vulgare]KAI0042692.1 TAP42-like protein [Auriscalpium vulgare]